MKKILIISDTHMPRMGKEIPEPVVEVLKDSVDCILHAGDWAQESVFEELKMYAPVYGVKGNVDKDTWGSTLPEKLIFEIEDVRIAIVHGHLGKGRSTPERAFRLCENDDVEVIIFGHSHIPFHEVKNNKILFNPGSPTDKRRQKQFSFGLAIVDQSTIKLNHHYFS
ncbi:hypothetical protein AWM68_06420 [Fictibacillus phosphorivorans]|uniref:Phosphoesterase n=1 Tax=Fictibacillus phosphorivorans TaxID=1221500 RepID=A0A165NGV2_9BACL|nr:metallophosphoesterase [Fictibacillus phosphorivorans]KZE66010.1 hypothetical protein AWM68_06420 [Fictibacillus phosphorivorans]